MSAWLLYNNMDSLVETGAILRRFFSGLRQRILPLLLFSAIVVEAIGQTPLTETIASRRSEERETVNTRRLDPEAAGWDTEVFSEKAETQLALLAKWLEQPAGSERPLLERILAEDFQGGGLLPDSLETVFDDGVIRVERAATASAVPLGFEVSPEGHPLQKGLEPFIELIERFGDGGPSDVAFKLFRVQMGGSEDPITRQYVALSGPLADGIREWNAVWTMRWETDLSTTEWPRIREIQVDAFEEVVTRGLPAGRSFLNDCTASLFRDVASFEEQMSFGTDHWMQHMERRFPVFYFGHQGMCLGDVNGDELEDLYVCQPGGLPNRLYLQNEDGSVRDLSSDAGVDLLDYTRSALLIDIDNDGDQDLVAGTLYKLLIFSNDGKGRFSLRVSNSRADAALSLAAADYDEDGDLDLYVCRYYSSQSQEGEFVVPLPFHDANNGTANRLLRNDGDWRFTDVTEETGLDANNRRFSFSAAWEDYDGDGDLDLYVANDFGRNNLFRNKGGRFSDVAAQAGVEDIGPGMSVTWGDYNRDGHTDLYVSNMFSAAGNRIAFQSRFQPVLETSDRALFQRHARGNSLFANLGDGTFSDASVASGTTMGRWAWGSLFADLNLDGWDDLLVCNGLVTGERLDDL